MTAPIPLTKPDGTVHAYACGHCGFLHCGWSHGGGWNERDADRTRTEAERCCTCHKCSAFIGSSVRYSCETCDAAWAAEEAFTLATVDDRALRFDSRRVRLVVAQLGGPPVLVVGGDLPPDGVEIDCDRLMADRAYALAMARRFAREVEANVRRDLLRQGPPHVTLAAAGEVADEHGAREDAMALREIARACDVHQIAWAEIDAGRALS